MRANRESICLLFKTREKISKKAVSIFLYVNKGASNEKQRVCCLKDVYMLFKRGVYMCVCMYG